MKSISPEIRALIENAPRPINENDTCWQYLAGYLQTILSGQSSGWHEFRVVAKRQGDGTVLLYMPTIKELS